ncbi:MAG: DUF4199 domain-containing protein [Woeseiaceae bacterium]|nr:DUF4199 domain-containing protein [Woeseiaceae bacterium]
MQKPILVYGVIAGLIIIGSAILSLVVGIASTWLGFLVMFIAFSTIFLAVKTYRDDALGGVIRFGTGFGLGLGITLVASLIYVFVWELYLVSTDYTFMDTYAASLLEKEKAGVAGTTGRTCQRDGVHEGDVRESADSPADDLCRNLPGRLADEPDCGIRDEKGRGNRGRVTAHARGYCPASDLLTIAHRVTLTDGTNRRYFNHLKIRT